MSRRSAKSNLLHHWRGEQSRRPAMWIAAMLLLLQPILSYLVAPQLASDQYGRQVLVCTLQGQQLINIGGESAPEGSTAEICPALMLLQIASITLAPAPHPLLTDSTGLSDLQHSRYQAQLSTGDLAAYSTRAPPLLS